LVTYLLKGYDSQAVVQSAANSPDGKPVMLGDLIPWPYADPGKVRTEQRFKVSHNLGPKQRALGRVRELEHQLRIKVPVPINPFRPRAPTLEEEAKSYRVELQPFRSKFEDGIRDVRRLYPHGFYRIITRQAAYPPTPVEEDEPCLNCQLREMADYDQ